MSDQQIPPVEVAGASDGPPSKRPCTIDTPPIANTPDNGSDFYNTPLAAGTPVIANTTSNPGTGVSVIEPSPLSKPTPVIPGLGLVNAPHDQIASMETTEGSALATAKPEPEATPIEQAAENSDQVNQNSALSDQGSSETGAKQESTDAAQGSHEAAAASSDTMEVDQKPDQRTPEITVGAPAEQVNDQTQEEEEEHPEWEVDSSPYESSSDSSTSSDSDDSDEEDYQILSPEEQARILMLTEAGSDDEGEGAGSKGQSGQIRSTNEIVEEVLPIPDVKITPEMNIVYLGKVQTAIDNAILIEANTSGEYQVLESGSLLCSADRQVLGVVSETLGRVEHPLYTVMYSTAAEAQERGMVKDLAVYYVEAYSTFVFTQPLKGMKGSDASNFHDEEVAEDEIEFSDDEAEAQYKKKSKKRQEGGKSKRGLPGPSKLSYTELNYDDQAGEDGYTPLARPKNLHEIMGVREAPVEGSDRGSGFRGGRGRGRGSDRGRGRGRGGNGRGGSWERDQGRHHQESNSQYSSPAPAQSQPGGYGQPIYQQQQPTFGMPNPYPAYQQYAPQQLQFGQGSAPTQFPFQFPFQQPFGQPNALQSIPPGAHVNPLFLAALQQQQQQQQYQQPQQQNPAMNFDQVKAQLDLLRNLSNGNQPPPS
ncbi:uncharacterized protein N7459_007338 [Penicillium hispanicum]|uniref:uncharacterized protein n=1 Tax=Penicillium hispanicum TaxID=1080232 RepID=UPI00254051AD|nr:uncharacterized protein N7459_007338 [Penicillium hispanicum]KAJ5578374.1 hypothetical protein N7459_007338 [Penicillium hispanicum]